MRLFIKTALRPDFRDFFNILTLFDPSSKTPIDFQRPKHYKPYYWTSKAAKIGRFSEAPAYKYMIKKFIALKID